MRRLGGVLGVVALAAGSMVVLAGSSAGATTVTDEASFRAAWTNAAETQIDLANDITFTTPCSSAATRSSTTPLVVNGNGHTLTLCTFGTAVLIQNQTGGLTFQNITVTGATLIGTSPGGAVLAAGPVTVTGSTFSNNRQNVGSGGAAIYSTDSVLVTNSTFTNNSTSFGAGGAIVSGNGVRVVNSTFTNNRVDLAGAGGSGGAIVAILSVVVVNSTFTGNAAPTSAGAIAAGSFLNVVYSTFTGNTSASGSALVSPLTRLFGTVLQKPAGTGDLCSGATKTSSGYNYANETANSCNLVATGDSSLDANNPQLGALAANGGPTQTQLPATGSPLINAIPNAACSGGNTLAGAAVTTDQRGLARPEQTGGSCDIGAVEVQLPPPIPAPIPMTPKFTG